MHIECIIIERIRSALPVVRFVRMVFLLFVDKDTLFFGMIVHFGALFCREAPKNNIPGRN